jgi:hydroxymethylglutaryl-CoA reductase
MAIETSRLPGLHRNTVAERLERIAEAVGLTAEQTAHLADTGNLTSDIANRLIENVIGTMNLPIGIATNMLVDGAEVLVPMATEESSVVAAVCNSARMCRDTGGFRTAVSGSEMIAQVQILDVPDPQSARLRLLERRDVIRQRCDAIDPVLVELGGGFRDLEVRVLETRGGPMVIVHLIVDTRDAMGANAVNSMAEALAPSLAEWAGGRALLRILSNLADRRLARASAVWPLEQIGGACVRDDILAAFHFAEADPYRAATHNKGIMNGISALALATGNDTRALEAGAHAYAARDGHYRALGSWEINGEGALVGSLEVPIAMGMVGGATRGHPTASLALAILGVETAGGLARVAAAVGLAQNFAALRALVTSGIQKGHMALHAQNIAMMAGARGEEIDRVAQILVERGEVRMDIAQAVLRDLSGSGSK